LKQKYQNLKNEKKNKILFATFYLIPLEANLIRRKVFLTLNKLSFSSPLGLSRSKNYPTVIILAELFAST
jgi:hypothetical protein